MNEHLALWTSDVFRVTGMLAKEIANRGGSQELFEVIRPSHRLFIDTYYRFKRTSFSFIYCVISLFRRFPVNGTFI